MPFDTLPSKATLKPTPFKVQVSDKDLEECLQLVRLSKIGPVTWENQVTDPKSLTSYGVKRQWLADLKEQWGSSYDWRKAEGRINRHPNFKVEIEYEGSKLDMHFAALFSKKADAIPLLLLHGWPGSFIEFLGVLNELSSKYDENNLPFHVIIPSLPGYVFSGGPPLDRDFIIEDVANVMDKLMLGLGFGDGYVVQGGDLGSYVARVIGVQSPACKAVHLNLCIGVVPESEEEEKSLSAKDQKAVNRIKDFTTMGSAYARFHGTRPSTIGLVLSTTPIALLAWIGEKFIQWSDETPPAEEILDSVSLWWFTQTFPRAIYPYRQPFGTNPTFFHPEAQWYIKKPLGYSWHPQELAPVPVSLVAKTGNLVWSREHDSGGHFAAMELPKQFVNDLEDYIKQVWPTAKNT